MTSSHKEIKGNVGEWSEIYTLLKLLGEGKLYAGDENLNKIENLVYPIIAIIRCELKQRYDYKCVAQDVVIQTSQGEELLRLPADIFLKEAEALYKVLCDKPKVAFPVARTQAFMDRIHCTTLKATTKDKTDIHIVLHDQRTKINNEMGFSIKSQIENAATLLNASEATNITYRVTGYALTDEDIIKINAINTKYKVIDRVKAIRDKGADLVYDHIDKKTFENNLLMLDCCMPKIIAQILVEQFNTGKKMFTALAPALAASNPMGFEEAGAEKMYVYKLKHLLTSVALGMMPGKEWSGRYDANGGFLVVKKDGEVLCYHFYDKNRFEDFLFKSAYLERSSTGRHKYASLYRGEDGEVYFKLNLQIRLKESK